MVYSCHRELGRDIFYSYNFNKDETSRGRSDSEDSRYATENFTVPAIVNIR